MFLLNLFLINVTGEYYSITLVSVCIILSGTGQSKRSKASKKQNKKKTHTQAQPSKSLLKNRITSNIVQDSIQFQFNSVLLFTLYNIFTLYIVG